MRLRHATFLFLPFVIAVSLLTSCKDMRFWESETAPPARKDPFNAAQLLDIRKRAATIQTELDRMPRQDFSFTVGDTMITATLYGEAGNPAQVDERWADRNGNSGRNRFYFDNGNLFHLYARSSIQLDPMGDAADRAETLYRLYFNANGNMFHYEKLMGESRIDLEEEEMPAFMRRAEALRQLGPPDSAGRFDTSAVIAILYSGESARQEPAISQSDDAPPSVQAPASSHTVSSDVSDQAVQPTQGTPTAKKTTPSQTNKTTLKEKQSGTAEQTARTPGASSTVRKSPPSVADKTAPSNPLPPKSLSSKQNTAAPKNGAPVDHTPQKSGLVRKAVPPLPDENAEAVIPAHTHRMIPGPLNSSRVRFQKGSTGITLSASLEKGRHNEYVLRARRGQTMQVTLDAEQPDAAFRVFLDNSDISGERRSWTGTLPRHADYHIVVYLKQQSGVQSAGYTITIGIP